MTSIDDLINSIKKPKKNSTYFNKMLNCLKYLKTYYFSLSREFPKFIEVYKTVEKSSEHKHHIPQVCKLVIYSREIEKYLEYIKNNKKSLENSLKNI